MSVFLGPLTRLARSISARFRPNRNFGRLISMGAVRNVIFRATRPSIGKYSIMSGTTPITASPRRITTMRRSFQMPKCFHHCHRYSKD